MKRSLWLAVFLMALLAGCAPSLKQLQTENTDLKMKLSRVEQENRTLKADLKACNHLSTVLAKEKEAREINVSLLRAKTRKFLKQEFDLFNQFSRNEELMDFAGGELIERENRDGKGLTIVNLKALSGDAVIYMVAGIFAPGTKVIPKLFRPTEKGLICVWQGQQLEATTVGANQLAFATPLNVLKGDFIGFYFPGPVSVPYDEKTGTFAVFSGDVKLGMPLPSTPKRDKRNYSLGVMGLIDWNTRKP